MATTLPRRGTVCELGAQLLSLSGDAEKDADIANLLKDRHVSFHQLLDTSQLHTLLTPKTKTTTGRFALRSGQITPSSPFPQAGSIVSWIQKLGVSLPLGSAIWQAVRATIGVRPDPFTTLRQTSEIHCIAVHHQRNLIAMALPARPHVGGEADTIYLFDWKSSQVNETVLVHAFHGQISSLVFNPVHPGLLAAVTPNGIALWHINSFSSRFILPNSAQGRMQFLPAPSGTNVATCSWSCRGDMLAVGFETTSSVIIWNVASGNHTTIRSPTLSSGSSFVSWSPSGGYLAVGSRGSGSITIWETHSWRAEEWTGFPGPCRLGCWSDDSRVLIVSIVQSPSLYWLRFSRSPPEISAQLMSHLDLTPAAEETWYRLPDVPQSLSDKSGIEVYDMAWDSRNQRLAVALRTLTSSDEEWVVLFQTSHSPAVELRLAPIGAILPPAPGARPRQIEFCPEFQRGTLMFVTWHTGLVASYPLYLEKR